MPLFLPYESGRDLSGRTFGPDAKSGALSFAVDMQSDFLPFYRVLFLTIAYTAQRDTQDNKY